MYDNLKKINKNKEWLDEELLKYKSSPSQTLIFVLNGDGSYYYQEKQN